MLEITATELAATIGAPVNEVRARAEEADAVNLGIPGVLAIDDSPVIARVEGDEMWLTADGADAIRRSFAPYDPDENE